MNLYDLLINNGYHLGRLVSWSKSEYRKENPNNDVYFNCNFLNEKGEKVWYGDMDVTVCKDVLQNICNILGVSFYILREMDCRFQTEEIDLNEVKELAVKTFSPE